MTQELTQELAQEQRLLTVEELKALPAAELLAIFTTLEAPAIHEMDGEFIGQIPLPDSIPFHQWMQEAGRGEWVGKCYLPQPYRDFPAQGYNTFITPEGVKRYSRFATYLGTSSYDGRPSFFMKYGVFDNVMGRGDVIDEVRRYAPNIYVCIGHAGGEPGTEHRLMGTIGPDGRSGPMPFIIKGPFTPAQGPDDFDAEVI